MNYDVSDEGQHTKLAVSSENLIDAPVIVGSKQGVSPILYQGTGILADSENPLVLPLLTADSTAYSYPPDQPIKEVDCITALNYIYLGTMINFVLVPSCHRKRHCAHSWTAGQKQRQSCVQWIFVFLL